jgi:hypothetical protein
MKGRYVVVISLPSHPNLTHLKRQAKALLKAHAQGQSDVCQTLKLLRRFEDATVQEMLAAPQCEKLLKRSPRGDIYDGRRRLIAERVLAKC